MKTAREQRYQQLFARTHAGIKPGLELITELLEALDNPQQRFLSVHVAGTNGKGSTCALLDSAVRELGLRSGLFTSPHLVRVNERIRINGVEISDDQFGGLLDQIEAVEQSLSRLPTFFETLTAMAFLAFAQEGVQVAVLETGLGGRLDCTNVVKPLLSVITRIDLDHTAYLGDTLTLIAGEKAGIIKCGRPVVMGAQPAEAAAVIVAKADEMAAPVRKAEEAVSVSGSRQQLQGQLLQLSGSNADYGKICFPLLGKYQLENLCTAVTAMELMQDLLGLEPDPQWIKHAVEKVQWRGRGQVLSVDPPLLLDVAHNPGGAAALSALLIDLFGPKRKGVLFWAALADKDVEGFLREMAPRFCRVICMDLQSERALPAEALVDLARKAGLEAECMPLSQVRKEAAQLIGDAAFGCVAGSVYLGGEWFSADAPDAGELLQS